MNKIFKCAVLAAGVLGLASCSDFLEQVSPSEKTIDETFATVKDGELFVNKIYGSMTDAAYGQQIPILMGAGTDCELIDGLGTESLNTTSERGNMNYNYSSAWTTLNTCWNGVYSVINYCNYAIQGAENSSLYKEDNKDMKRLLGEALTLRAMAYLDLTRMWGDVPYRTEKNLQEVYQGKTDRDIIQDACITDLQRAVEMLPWAGEDGTTVERVTKGYALGLLAQTALTRAGYSIREEAKAGYENLEIYSDATYPTQRPAAADRQKYYEIAAKACAQVINDNHHEMNGSFEEYWKAINQLRLDPTRESMFEIANGCGVTGGLGYTVGKRINGATKAFGGKGNSSGKLKLTGQLWQTYHNTGASTVTNNGYQSIDKRRDVTFALFQYKEAANLKYYNVTHTETLFYDDKQCTAPFAFYCGKWNPEWWNEALTSVAHNANDAKWATGINVVRMRYPQILLMYAEACYQLGGETKSIDGAPTALQVLKDVHKRSYEDKAAGETFIENLAKENFMEAIYAENAWEFAGEGIRKWDLIRWGQLSQKIIEAKQDFVNGVRKQPSQGGYPRFFFYRFKEVEIGGEKLLAADPTSFCWAGTEVYPVKEDGKTKYDKNNCQSQKWFAHADNGISDATIKTNLPSICDGLNPWNDLTFEKPYNVNLFNTLSNTTVKNRYILPIGAITISASNGTLKNSYGHQ